MSGWVVVGYLVTGLAGAIVFLHVVSSEIAHGEAEIKRRESRGLAARQRPASDNSPKESDVIVVSPHELN